MENLLESISNICKLMLPALLTIVLPAVLIILRHVSNKFTSKLDAQTKVAVNEMLMNFVGQGVAYAEQESKRFRKQAQERMNGDHKLDLAVAYVAGEIKKFNLPQLAETELKNKVESYLGIGTLNSSLLIQEDDDESTNFSN